MKKQLSLLCALFFSVLSLQADIPWAPSFAITDLTGIDAASPHIAVTPNGDAAAVWYYEDEVTGFRTVQGATKSKNGEWTNYHIFSTNTISDAPYIALDASGNGVVVWTESTSSGPGSHRTVRAAQLLNGAWTSSTEISDHNSNADSPSVGLDANGNAIAIWNGRVGFAQVVQSRTMNGGVWGATTNLSDSSQNTTNPQIGVNANGNAVAVWERPDGVHYVIQSKSLISGTWDVSATDLSDTSQDAFGPQIAVTNNKAVAVWRRDDGSGLIFIVTSKTKTMPSGTWDAIAQDLSDASTTVNPHISLDTNSNGVAVWQGKNDLALASYRIQAIEYINGSWNFPTVTISDIAHDNENPQVAVDFLTGDAVAIWQQEIGIDNYVIQTASLPFNGNWSPIRDLSPNPPNGITPQDPQVAMDANGVPSAVWTQNGSPYNIWYDSTTVPVQPPTSLSGKQKNDNFGTLSELFNQLKWNASLSDDITGYAIYRNGTLIATVGSNVFRYEDHNRKKGQSTTYGVAAINASGSQSSQITITIH